MNTAESRFCNKRVEIAEDFLRVLSPCHCSKDPIAYAIQPQPTLYKLSNRQRRKTKLFSVRTLLAVQHTVTQKSTLIQGRLCNNAE
jgi:hypothetical protein